jgi:hypothetical protein
MAMTWPLASISLKKKVNLKHFLQKVIKFEYVLLMGFCNFNVSRVSKGVKGSFKSTTSTVSSGKSLMYFSLFLASGIFLVFIAFTIFLPVMVIMPQKFAICFTVGCAFIIGSFFALKGPKNQLYHMISKEVLYLLSYSYKTFSSHKCCCLLTTSCI